MTSPTHAPSDAESDVILKNYSVETSMIQERKVVKAPKINTASVEVPESGTVR